MSGDELIGTRYDGQPPHRTERPSAVSQTEAYGVVEQERTSEVSGQIGIGVLVFGWLKGLWLQGEIYSHSLSIRAVDGPKPNYVWLIRGQDHPISAAGTNQPPGGPFASLNCGHYVTCLRLSPDPKASTANLGMKEAELTLIL